MNLFTHTHKQTQTHRDKEIMRGSVSSFVICDESVEVPSAMLLELP